MGVKSRLYLSHDAKLVLKSRFVFKKVIIFKKLIKFLECLPLVICKVNEAQMPSR